MKIGMMSFAHHHAEGYIHHVRAVPGVELIGLADDNEARGRHFANLYETSFFPSYDALIAAQPDGIMICSENSRHRHLVEKAAAAGIHVFCEKPLATTRADAEAMIHACQQAGVWLMTAFPMRFSAPLQQVKTSLQAGDLGKVFCVSSTNQGQLPTGHRDWFADKKLAGGGAMMDHIVHLADILNWLFGTAVSRVYAQANRIMHKDVVDVETGGLVMLTYANGLFATIDTSWSKPLNYPTWGGLVMEFISEQGLTVVDAFSQNLNVYQQDPPAHVWNYWGSDANQAMIADFVSAFRDNRPPAITGEDGLFALNVVLAAYESAARNEIVNF